MEEEKEQKIKKGKFKDNKKKKHTAWALPVSILSLFSGALIMYLVLYYIVPIDNSSTIINRSEKEVTIDDKGIADAVEKLYDAVVVVEVYSGNNIASTGTGFVYKSGSQKAYILTNSHVVSSVTNPTVKVIFTNGESEEVKIEGKDEYADLAVLSISPDKIISVAEIGKSEDMRLGDTVFTCGAPLDTEYYWTVTRGVLSGKDRMVEVTINSTSTGDYVMKVLQTDASINSGNSGGPLANSNGEVIGITNMKLVSSGVEGIGFAIPIEDAITFAESIINGEEIKKPLLGVSTANWSDSEQDKWNLFKSGISINTELKHGVVVVEVQKGSPADKAGLKKSDIITKIEDIEIKSSAQLRYALYRYSVGDTVSVSFERDGKMQTTNVKLTVAAENN